MKLALFSGGHDDENIEMDKALVEMTGVSSPTITYIPSSSYDSEIEFREFVRRFRKYNVTKFLHFPIDVPFDQVLLKEVLKSDVIFLSGGNTFYFLHHLRRTKLLNSLKTFAKSGGVLAGLSAGAILMTPSIHTAGFPSFNCDDNDEGLTNWKSLNLVPFEFFPHYVNSKRYIEEVVSYSELTKNHLYASTDGSGILVKNDQVQFIGKHYCFHKGEKFKLY